MKCLSNIPNCNCCGNQTAIANKATHITKGNVLADIMSKEELADLVSSLRAENEELNRLVEGYKLVGKAYDSAIACNLKLEKELAEAREIANLVDYTDRSRGYPTPNEWGKLVSIARAFLEKTK